METGIVDAWLDIPRFLTAGCQTGEKTQGKYTLTRRRRRGSKRSRRAQWVQKNMILEANDLG